MRQIMFVLVAVAALAGAVASMAPAPAQNDGEAAPIFGITIPPGYRDWKLISVAHEEGNLNDLRAILGNDIAFKAARDGTLPYPDGSIVARVAWSYDPLEESSKAFGTPIFRGRGTQERGSIHGQRFKKIRRDGRLGVRAVQRRQTRERGGAQHLLSLPRDRQSARSCLQPLRAVTAHTLALRFAL